MDQFVSFFQNRQRLLILAASIYVISLVIFHWQFAPVHVWLIAAFFSIIMNFVYITEAWSLRRFTGVEAMVAAALICLSVLGVLVAPLFVIFAIFAHGIWDIAKHFGAGVPFFAWYTFGCFTVDTIYSAALLVYWLA